MGGGGGGVGCVPGRLPPFARFLLHSIHKHSVANFVFPGTHAPPLIVSEELRTPGGTSM